MSFLSATKKALAEGEAALVGEIRRAASEPRHWTAAAWLLERRNPKAWGRRDCVAPSAGTRVEAPALFPPPPSGVNSREFIPAPPWCCASPECGRKRIGMDGPCEDGRSRGQTAYIPQHEPRNDGFTLRIDV